MSLSSTQQHVEGVVLQAIPFGEYDRIITFFSDTAGMVKCFVKNAAMGKKNTLAWLSPFARGEFAYLPPLGDGQLCTFKEGALLDSYEELREDFSFLETAGKLAKAILTTQWPGKGTPILYQLLLSYLKTIPHTPSGPLLSSFYLKLLRHEGLLSLEKSCETCHHFLTERYFVDGHWRCLRHAPLAQNGYEPLCFSQDEFICIEFLAHCRLFSQMAEMPDLSSLYEKIERLFLETIANG